MKQGREVRISISDLFRTVYGTVDTKPLRSVYMNMSSWLSPKYEENWDRESSRIKTRIKKSVHKTLLTPPLQEKSIVDLDLRTSGVAVDKRSFVKCEITLFLDQKVKTTIKSPELQSHITQITENVIQDAFLSSELFDFYKTKK